MPTGRSKAALSMSVVTLYTSCIYLLLVLPFFFYIGMDVFALIPFFMLWHLPGEDTMTTLVTKVFLTDVS